MNGLSIASPAFLGLRASGPPIATLAPVISGAYSEVGETWTVTNNGTWTQSPTGYTYQWYSFAGPTPIGGETNNSYVLAVADIGFQVYCEVTATNGSGSGALFSNGTLPVYTPVAAVNTVAPVVSGDLTVGQTLTTTDGTWTGAAAPTFTYQWNNSLAGNIGGATSFSYVTQAGDIGADIKCIVTGTNSSGAVPADSNTVGPITA